MLYYSSLPKVYKNFMNFIINIAISGIYCFWAIQVNFIVSEKSKAVQSNQPSILASLFFRMSYVKPQILNSPEFDDQR
jgi:hypothetical protein